ncbi:MAG: F0F1 ATP synthase subunit epsilon [Deltaproteobacteria bacterium]|jgi:F-type H+-transporting ATPase subunit epsilon|nr:F0F1 ATP synthase subunit epsilon [Deltaproteobacteria bacterium]MBT4263911.1 F0F1 ATP synthase subunit epsilon [Deltaproteobacteria bacterium]MBT4639854.1 F0F1 ATP synthase subunit epsilon [Deltaproteobacteria bacterium]MBT6503147.1 F0F1 ATP synthase subunit epsilon [Deltaproteobacteria bacterium]MBT6611057.1 F0F1 ATP synthase subunit epsilon [Deltaproteobacteria bacterium]
MTLNLEIVTPQRILLATEAEYVTIPGEIGELGILPGHIPLLTNLQSGILSYKSGGTEEMVAVHSGYAEICRDKITILAKIAELKDDIDLERSKTALQAAEKELEEALKDVDQLEKAGELQQKIKRALTRQQVVA